VNEKAGAARPPLSRHDARIRVGLSDLLSAAQELGVAGRAERDTEAGNGPARAADAAVLFQRRADRARATLVAGFALRSHRGIVALCFVLLDAEARALN